MPLSQEYQKSKIEVKTVDESTTTSLKSCSKCLQSCNKYCKLDNNSSLQLCQNLSSSLPTEKLFGNTLPQSSSCNYCLSSSFVKDQMTEDIKDTTTNKKVKISQLSNRSTKVSKTSKLSVSAKINKICKLSGLSRNFFKKELRKKLHICQKHLKSKLTNGLIDKKRYYSIFKILQLRAADALFDYNYKFIL